MTDQKRRPTAAVLRLMAERSLLAAARLRAHSDRPQDRAPGGPSRATGERLRSLAAERRRFGTGASAPSSSERRAARRGRIAE